MNTHTSTLAGRNFDTFLDFDQLQGSQTAFEASIFINALLINEQGHIHRFEKVRSDEEKNKKRLVVVRHVPTEKA